MEDARERKDRPSEGIANRAARIQDVAHLAGVSTATVSRALATPDRVSDEARIRVLDAIALTGYVPNPAARSLRSQKTNMILVVLPDLANTFFSKILRGIEETLFDAGYGMIISDLDGSPAKEAHFAAFTAAGRVDGAVLLNGHLFGQSRDGQGNPANITVPLVALCEAIPGADIPQIGIDNRAAARTMTEFLASLGHTRIAYVSGPPANILEKERFGGYCDGLQAVGLPLDQSLIIPGDYTLETGAAAGRRLLTYSNLPTAVFSTSDEMALGLIRALTLAGVKVPDDVSVAGFDDIEFAAATEPALTTIRQPRRELGQTAAKVLIDLLHARPCAKTILLETNLVMRDSVAPPSRSR